MERHGMPDYQREPPEQRAAVVDGARQLFLDAGRVLMLWGWGALAAASTAGQSNDDDTSSAAVNALLAFVVWLLGVSFVMLVHVERRRFPGFARIGAVVANVVMDCFFVRPRN